MEHTRLRSVAVLLLGLLVVVSGCGATTKAGSASGGSKPVKLTFAEVAASPVVTAAGVVAQAKGYFAAEGIKPAFIAGGGGGNVQMLLGSGSAQFAVISAVEIPHAYRQPGNPVAVLPMTVGMRHELMVSKAIAARRDITAGLPPKTVLEKIKGLTIVGSSPDGLATLVVNYALKLNGFNPAGYLKWTYAGDPVARASMFITGAVDMVALTAYSERKPVLKSGKGIIVLNVDAVPPLGRLYNLVLAAPKKLIQTEPGVVRRTVVAFRRALNFLYLHPKQSIGILAKHYRRKLSAQAVAATFNQDLAPSLVRRVEASSAYRMTAKGWQQVERMDLATGVIKKSVDTKAGVMWTNRFLQPAKAS